MLYRQLIRFLFIFIFVFQHSASLDGSSITHQFPYPRYNPDYHGVLSHVTVDPSPRCVILHTSTNTKQQQKLKKKTIKNNKYHRSILSVLSCTLREFSGLAEMCSSVGAVSILFPPLRYNGRFPGGPRSVGTRMSQFWTLLALRVMEVVTTEAITRVIRLQ